MSGRPRIRLVSLALLSASVIVLPASARQYDLRPAPGIGGDPLHDIENLRKTRLVIADGRVLSDKTSGRETTSASRR